MAKGKLFIIGGCIIALGGLVFLVEFLLCKTFGIPFDGWSTYPVVTLGFVGILLLYLAINKSARDAVARKFFF